MKFKRLIISLGSVSIISVVPIVESCGTNLFAPYVPFFESNDNISYSFDLALYGDIRDENNFLKFMEENYFAYSSSKHTIITSIEQLPQRELFNATLFKNINFDDQTNTLYFDADRYESDKKGKWELTDTAKNVYVNWIEITDSLLVNEFINNYSIYLDSEILAKSEDEIIEYVLQDFNQSFYKKFGLYGFNTSVFNHDYVTLINEENYGSAFDSEYRNEEGNYILYYFLYGKIDGVIGIKNSIGYFENDKLAKIKLSELLGQYIKDFEFNYDKETTTNDDLYDLSKGDLRRVNLIFENKTNKLHYVNLKLRGLIFRNEVAEGNSISSDEQLQTAIKNGDKILMQFYPLRLGFPFEEDLVVELNFY